jgi:hypothetical protein
MPLENPPSTGGAAGTPVGAMGLLATNPAAVSTGYSWSYTASAKAFPSYTAQAKTSSYSGGLLDLLQAARLSDLNDLRVAVENLRRFTEALAQQHNAVSLDLAAAGIISTNP